MKYAIAHETQIGRRPSNQDRLGHWRAPESLLLVVADGMGGHEHGDYAAEFALRYLAAAFRREAAPRLAAPARFLRRTVLGAHAALLQEARSLELDDTPRTTIVSCVVQQGRAWWGHVGDSRLYLVRRGAIAARTADHTLVQLLVDEGVLRPSDARGHPQRNQLLQCLGGLHAPVAEPATALRLERDDILLLCSDGFWEPLLDRQIVAGLESGSLAEGIARLSGLARELGGADADNITALALQWEEAGAVSEDLPADAPEDDAGNAVPDPDILRAMEDESTLQHMRQALRSGG